MRRAVLEVIITHWKEPFASCEKMFQMLDVQRGMTREECRVTLVQDGEDNGIDRAKLMRSYPFVTRTLQIPHGGVSAARNAGMDAADAEFVMFCDCDDMFYACDSLRMILNTLQGAGKNADLVWAPFYIENRTPEGRWFRTPQGWNNIFIHGKCWRLDWLREKDLRFAEGIAYSEDALFCAEAAMELRPGQIRQVPEAAYIWCLRGGSCTNDPRNISRNRAHLLRHRILLPQIAKKRKPEEAAAKAARGIFDEYYELTGGQVPAIDREELEAVTTRELILPWEEAVRAMNADERRQIMMISRESAVRERKFEMETVLFPDWIREMKEKHGNG